MQEVEERKRKKKLEQLRKEHMQKQKLELQESRRNSADEEDADPINFSEIIAQLKKKREEINNLKLPEEDVSESKMEFISRFEVLKFNVEGNSVIDAIGSSEYHSNVSNHRVRKGNLSGDVMDAKIGTMPQEESSWTSSPQQAH
jgi:transcription elongation GreA/GreB family factor